MPRRKPRPAPPPAQPQSWNLTSTLLALAAGGVGAGITWWLLPSQRGTPTLVPIAAAAAAPDMPPSTVNLPPAQAALQLGNWHYDRQRWKAAVEQYEAAIRLGVDNADVRTDLGNCLRFLDQPDLARKQYEIAQGQDAQHENSLLNLAALHAQVLRDHSKARAYLNEYIRRFPASEGLGRARQLLSEIGDDAKSKVSPETEKLLKALVKEER